MDAKTTLIVQRIEGIRRELEQIKRLLLAHEKEPQVSLYGLWAGANISDEDIEEAKRSWHKEVEALDR